MCMWEGKEGLALQAIMEAESPLAVAVVVEVGQVMSALQWGTCLVG